MTLGGVVQRVGSDFRFDFIFSWWVLSKFDGLLLMFVCLCVFVALGVLQIVFSQWQNKDARVDFLGVLLSPPFGGRGLGGAMPQGTSTKI